jgi:Carboxypeptidase regulatory-like domain
MMLAVRGQPLPHPARRAAAAVALAFCAVCALAAQQPASTLQASAQSAASEPQPVAAPVTPVATSSVSGTIADTDGALVPRAHVALQDIASTAVREAESDGQGAFAFSTVSPGQYVVTVHAAGFSPWKIHDVIIVHEGEDLVIPEVQLGVEAINTSVNAISVEDLAERQITAEEHQRILGILPNFYVSYLPDAQPLTRKQKFKLAIRVSVDPITFLKVGVASGIEQWQDDFSGYGQEFSGYAKRFGAGYGDSISSTFLGAALFPSLFHQDPRYYYRGHGHVVVRALYAISTTVVCKGDSGHWQPNFSNVLGNLGAAGISSLYYPSSDRHSVQVTVDNTLLGVAEGAFGTLFQEFLLHYFTHGVPPAQP